MITANNGFTIDKYKTDRLLEEYQEEPELVTMAKTFADAIMRQLALRPGMNCLEFGCGRGNLALLLPEKLQITALDPATAVIEVLERKIAGMNVSNITPLTGDIMEWQASHAFDLVYSTLAMHHIKDIDALLQKCNRILNTSGDLILIDLDKEDGTFHDDNSQIHHFGFEREWLKDKLERNGLVLQSIDEVYRREKTRPDGKKVYPMFMAVAKKF